MKKLFADIKNRSVIAWVEILKNLLTAYRCTKHLVNIFAHAISRLLRYQHLFLMIDLIKEDLFFLKIKFRVTIIEFQFQT